MIYYIFYEWLFKRLSGQQPESVFFKALNVFQYVTFRTAYATITALLISLIFGGRVIRALRELNVGQQIREEGPQAHMAKRGTPTMGGILIIASILVTALLLADLRNFYVLMGIVCLLGMGAIGCGDDDDSTGGGGSTKDGGGGSGGKGHGGSGNGGKGGGKRRRVRR